LWVYVVNTSNPITAMDARALVETRNVPEGLQATTVLPAEVHVQLQGRMEALEPFENQQMRARLVGDLAGKSAGSHEVTLEPVGLPRGVEVIASPFLRATVQLEEVTSDKRRVIVQHVGSPVEGFQCTPEPPRPGTVVIRGPQTAVDSVRNVVARISVSGLETTTDFRPAVQPVNVEGARVDGVVVAPQQVAVHVIVQPVPHQTVVVQPDLGSPPPGRQIDRLSVEPATVVVSGPRELLDTLTSILTRKIDLSGVDRQTTREVSLAPPRGTSISGPTTATVTVFLKPFRRVAAPPAEGPPGPGEAEPGEGEGSSETNPEEDGDGNSGEGNPR